jgi:hypothetical protein
MLLLQREGAEIFYSAAAIFAHFWSENVEKS